MEKEEIIKELKRKDTITNRFALERLLDYGRNNLLNEQFYKTLIDTTEKHYNSGIGIPIMPKDYALGIIRASKQMAMLETKDLCDLIQAEIFITQKVEQELEYGEDEEYSEENTSPDYEY